MRTAASFVAPLALAALVRLPLQAQRPDSAMVGRWAGQAVLTAPVTQQHELSMQLDIRDNGIVTGMVGDALLVDAHIYRDNRLAQVLRLGRQYAVDGHLSGDIIRRESVNRETVHLSLDRMGTHLTGYLQTSGSYEGEIGDRLLYGTVSLERVPTPILLGARSAVNKTADRVAVRQPAP